MLHLCGRRIIVHFRFLTSSGHQVTDPTILLEDNSATISHVLRQINSTNQAFQFKKYLVTQQETIRLFYS